MVGRTYWYSRRLKAGLWLHDDALYKSTFFTGAMLCISVVFAGERCPSVTIRYCIQTA